MGELLGPVELEMLDLRRKVYEVEERMRDVPDSFKREIAVEHYSHGGVYARKIIIPKDTLLTGQIHKYDNMNFMLSGDLLVLIGNVWARAQGPGVILAPAGVKRLAYAIEETIWVTVLPTNEQDPQVIEKMFVATTEEDYQQFLTLQRAEATKWLS